MSRHKNHIRTLDRLNRTKWVLVQVKSTPRSFESSIDNIVRLPTGYVFYNSKGKAFRTPWLACRGGMSDFMYQSCTLEFIVEKRGERVRVPHWKNLADMVGTMYANGTDELPERFEKYRENQNGQHT